MPASHALYSKMLAERTASRNVFVLFYFILLGTGTDPCDIVLRAMYRNCSVPCAC